MIKLLFITYNKPYKHILDSLKNAVFSLNNSFLRCPGKPANKKMHCMCQGKIS